MDVVGLQLSGASAYPLNNLSGDRTVVDGAFARVQGGNLNPIDRVQSVGLAESGTDGGSDTDVETGYAYGPFYTNRLIYLDIQAELMVVQFRDALDREVRLQYPPELTLKAYRSGAPEERDPAPAVTGATDPVALPGLGKPANDGLPEALAVDTFRKPTPADTPAGVAPVSDREKAPPAPVPGQTVELVA